MSDLTATNCGCGCGNDGGNNNCLFLILILLFCGGCGNGCGNNGFFGGNDCCSSIIWLFILFSCCGCETEISLVETAVMVAVVAVS